MKRTLRNIVTGAVLGLASLMPIKAEAQRFNGNLDVVRSEKDSASFLRPNLFYKNDAIDLFAFGEFYRGRSSGYFGKITAKTELEAPIQPSAELVYFGNGKDIHSTIGLGVSADMPMPKDYFLNVKALPFWVDEKSVKEVDNVNHKFMVGYFATGKLPLGMNLVAFGELNADAKYTKRPVWGYGEIQLSKKLSDHLSVSYNPLLKNKDKALPRWENAISANIKF